MPSVLRTAQVMQLTGLEVVHTACDAAGNHYANAGNTFLWFKSTAIADKTITVNRQRACEIGSDHDDVITLTAGEERLCGPYNTYWFNDANGYTYITYSDVTDITLAIIQMPDSLR